MVGRSEPGPLECCAVLNWIPKVHDHLAEVLPSEARKFGGKNLPVIGGYPAATHWLEGLQPQTLEAGRVIQNGGKQRDPRDRMADSDTS